MLPGTMSPGIAVNGHHLVGSEDEMESMASPPILNPPTPGSPVFPGLVQLSTQDVNTTPEKPKRMHENTLDALMRNSLINSPSKGRSPIRRRSTPKKRIPPQSPNGKKFKQLKMDVFSPAKQNVEEPKSPFKIPQSPYGRKFVKFYTFFNLRKRITKLVNIVSIFVNFWTIYTVFTTFILRHDYIWF